MDRNKNNNRKKSEELEGMGTENVRPAGAFTRSNLMKRTSPAKVILDSNAASCMDVNRKTPETPVLQHKERAEETPNCSQPEKGQSISPREAFTLMMKTLLHRDDDFFRKISATVSAINGAIKDNTNNTIKEGTRTLMELLEIEAAAHADRRTQCEKYIDIVASGFQVEINAAPLAARVQNASKSVGTSLKRKAEDRDTAIQEQTDERGYQTVVSKRARRLHKGAAEKAIASPSTDQPKRSASQAKKTEAKDIRKNKTLEGVGSKKQANGINKRHRRVRIRGDAIILKPADGKTFSDVLKAAQNVKPDEAGVTVQAVQKTRDNSILIKIAKGAENRNGFCAALKLAVGKDAIVKDSEPGVTLEIRDIDSEQNEATVRAALIKMTNEKAHIMKCRLSSENSRGQKIANVTVDEDTARAIMKTRRITIGWVNCRVRQKHLINRCHKCLGFGHLQRGCNGQDRSKCCLRCGCEGHKAADCTTTKCFLCTKLVKTTDELEHIPGTGACKAFRNALAATRKQENA